MLVHDQAAATGTSPGEPDHAMYQSNLAEALSRRFERTRHLPDLQEAVDRIRSAMATAHPSDPLMSLYLTTMSHVARAWSTATGDPSLLDEGVAAARTVVDRLPASDVVDAASAAEELGAVLAERFHYVASVADIDEAIAVTRNAAAASMRGSPDYVRRMSVLSGLHWKRFEKRGDFDDLHGAIETIRTAITAAPTGDRSLAGALSDLGWALHARYRRIHETDDLDEAIVHLTTALDLTDPDDPDRFATLNNLALAYRARFEDRHRPDDLDRTITAARELLAGTPAGDRRLPGRLSTLGGVLQSQYELTHDAAVLDEAIGCFERAVAAIPPDDPDRAGHWSNLGAALRLRFIREPGPEVLNRSIEAGVIAVDSTDVHHRDRAGRLMNLAYSYLDGYHRFGNRELAERAMAALVEASSTTSGPPAIRTETAIQGAEIAVRIGRVHEAADGYRTAIGLLPRLAWPGLARDAQEQVLRRTQGLPADAAAAMVSTGRRDHAVELLDQGRAVLWNQFLSLRSPMTALEQVAPHLAGRLRAVAQELG
jgi:tetratricopeptide (TPR) repeat protein